MDPRLISLSEGTLQSSELDELEEELQTEKEKLALKETQLKAAKKLLLSKAEVLLRLPRSGRSRTGGSRLFTRRQTATSCVARLVEP